jgi:hypothetical protein
MTANRALLLTLEPTPDDGRIAGRLCDEHGEGHDFACWLGLLALLEDARVRASSLPDSDARGEAAMNSDHDATEAR